MDSVQSGRDNAGDEELPRIDAVEAILLSAELARELDRTLFLQDRLYLTGTEYAQQVTDAVTRA